MPAGQCGDEDAYASRECAKTATVWTVATRPLSPSLCSWLAVRGTFGTFATPNRLRIKRDSAVVSDIRQLSRHCSASTGDSRRQLVASVVAGF
jgi:hypothetical protein